MRTFLAVCALLASLCAPACGQQSKSSMDTTISTNFPNNTTGAITPAIAVTTFQDMVASYQQATQIRAVTSTTDTILVTDYGWLVTYNNGSGVAVTLPQATGSFSVFNVTVSNVGSGNVTVTPTTSTIGGLTSLVVGPGQKTTIVSDGTNYQLGVTTNTLGIGVTVNTNSIFISSTTTLSSGDCGNAVTAGGNTNYTITLPGASSVPAGCVITLYNGDGGRGKRLSGFPGDLNDTLWPDQTLAVFNFGASEWLTISNPGRYRLQGGTNFFIDPVNGSDTAADGLASGTGAFATSNRMATVVSNMLDTRGQLVNVSYASATYTNMGSLNFDIVGGGTVNLTGNGATATSSTAGVPAIGIACSSPTGAAFNGSCADVQGFTVTCSGGGFGLQAYSGVVTLYQSMVFGTCTSGIQVFVNNAGASIVLNSSYSITGGASFHLASNLGNITYGSSANTVTLTGTPAFSTAFAFAGQGGTAIIESTFSGAATGTRYQAVTGGTIFTNGGGANYFPGNAAGFVAQGGHYDSPGTPTVAGCGTSPGGVTGTDTSFWVTEGSSATGCTFTFASANAPTWCVFQSNNSTLNGSLVLFSLSSTQAVITHSSVSGAVVGGICPKRGE